MEANIMKNILSLFLVAGFSSLSLAETPKAPTALVVQVEKSTGKTKTFEVSSESVNLKNKAVFSEFVKTLTENSVEVTPRVGAGEEMGENDSTAAWGYWHYHNPYFFNAWSSFYWNFPTYSWNTWGYSNFYYPYNYVTWGNYYYYCYYPRWW
jgi:hypothetical protein